MKYVRTNDGKIFDLTKKEYLINGDDLILHRKYETVGDPNIDIGQMYVPSVAIITKHNNYVFVGIIEKRADTIEDLLDGFIVENKEDHSWFFMDVSEFKERHETLINWIYTGFIKTPNGFTYVAKLNKNGELELL